MTPYERLAMNNKLDLNIESSMSYYYVKKNYIKNNKRQVFLCDLKNTNSSPLNQNAKINLIEKYLPK